MHSEVKFKFITFTLFGFVLQSFFDVFGAWEIKSFLYVNNYNIA